MSHHVSEVQHHRFNVRKAVRFSLYLLAFFLLFLCLWISKYFGTPDLEQILYHLSFGPDGLLGSDPILIRRFIKWCVIPPIALSVLAIYAEKSNCLRLIVNEAKRHRAVRLLALRTAPMLLLGMAVVLWMYQVSAVAYVTSNFGPDYFTPHYLSPAKVEVKVKKPKNLVLIYVESLETSYSNKNLFGRDLLDSLGQLGGVSFNNYQQAPGTGWTIAAITATQCGVPLKRVTVYDENTQGRVLKSFLPNAVCLSDMLAKLGYHNVFMEGASLTFAGKGKFLRDHHYEKAYGKEEWIERGVRPEEMNGWGLYDDDLFERAKRKLEKLERSKQPFNLTLLTVDTHEPTGHLSKKCAQRSNGEFDGIVKCTADQVADFVNFIKDNGYLDNTNIVIIGDHLARKNPVFDKLSTVPDRRIFNLFISATPPEKNRENILHFDLFPTILEFLGVEIVGDRLGLGYSAFYRSNEHPPMERLHEMQLSLMNKSEAYLGLWQMTGQH